MTGIHVFIGKIKPQVKTGTTREEFTAYLDKVRVHFNAFPNIKNVRVGQTYNSPEKNKGYDFLVVLEFVDDEKCQEVLNSPETVAARAALLEPFVDDLIVADIAC